MRWDSTDERGLTMSQLPEDWNEETERRRARIQAEEAMDAYYDFHWRWVSKWGVLLIAGILIGGLILLCGGVGVVLMTDHFFHP